MTLEQALALWATSPSPALARTIHALSDREAHPTPAALRGASPDAHKAWMDLAARGDPRDIPALLETLLSGRPATYVPRLQALEGRPDPRIDRWCVEVLEFLEERPYRSKLTRKYLSYHLERLLLITDAALLPRIEALPARYRRDQEGGLARWLGLCLEVSLPGLRSRLQALPEPPEPPPVGAPVDPEALLAQVYADPFDDGARAVYADALLELGDPRGEFIALQLRPALDKREQQRVAELVAGYGRQWLGPLSPLIADGFTFERGFLGSCAFNAAREGQVRELEDHPMWSTVRSLSGSVRLGLHPGLRSLRELSVAFDSDFEGDIDQPWVELLTATERPLEVLRYCRSPMVRGDDLEHLSRCEALPRLKELSIWHSNPLMPAILLQAPIAQRLQSLTFESFSPTEVPLELLAEAAPPTLTLQMGYNGMFRVLLSRTKGETGYDTLTAYSPGIQWCIDALFLLLQALPGVDAVRLNLREISREEADQVRARLEALPLASLQVRGGRRR